MAKQAPKKGNVRKQRNHEASDRESASEQFFKRILHRAYLRDGDITHTGEALALAMLLHAKGKARDNRSVEEVGKMLNDPNLSRE
jgi:hypothetical protein